MSISKIYDALSKTEWFTAMLKCYREVYQELGHGRSEKKYQKAFSDALSDHKIKHEREFSIETRYNEKCVGEGFSDFFINGEAVIEMKAISSEIRPKDIRQLQNYLNDLSCKLGFCINFPETYQESLTIVMLINVGSEYFSLGEEEKVPLSDKEKVASGLDGEWRVFSMRMKAVPHKRHKIKTLGILAITS